MREFGILDLNTRFWISFLSFLLPVFLLWWNSLRKLVINNDGISFKNLYTSRTINWKQISSVKLEGYNAFRISDPQLQIGTRLIRLFYPDYGRGTFVLLKNKQGRDYRFFATQYVNSKVLIEEIKRRVKK